MDKRINHIKNNYNLKSLNDEEFIKENFVEMIFIEFF